MNILTHSKVFQSKLRIFKFLHICWFSTNKIFYFSFKLAINGRSRKFVESSTVQLFMKSLWFGTSNSGNSKIDIRTYISVCCPIIAPILLKDSFEDYDGFLVKIIKFLHFPRLGSAYAS